MQDRHMDENGSQMRETAPTLESNNTLKMRHILIKIIFSTREKES